MIFDPINHPIHYNSSKSRCPQCQRRIECIDITKHMAFDLGNAVKYIWRAGLKAGAVTDLKKAVWYLNCAIERIENEHTEKKEQGTEADCESAKEFRVTYSERR